MNNLIKENKKWIDEIWSKIVEKARRYSITCKHKLPLVTENGVYDDSAIVDISAWTNGFMPGIMWMLYAATGEEGFRETAENAEIKLDEAMADYNSLHHDVGFMWHISAGANYRLTKNEKSKNRNLHAASVLASRYNVEGKFFKAWNEWGEHPHHGWVIVDSMMNLPLLYWAERETNNIAFKQIAMNHADTLLKNHIRPDGSVYHIVNYDYHTGEFLGAAPHTQGYEPVNSSWSRGQAWAIYGFVLSYIHTGEIRYLNAAKNVAHYFIAAICTDDYVPKCDFRSPEEPVLYDTSAGAITACGLIEIAKAVPDYEKKMYFDAAIKILKALTEKHCDWSETEESILQNSMAYYKHGQHRAWIYGEYYLVEAFYKLKGFDLLMW